MKPTRGDVIGALVLTIVLFALVAVIFLSTLAGAEGPVPAA